MKKVQEIIREAEQNYTQGETKLGDYVSWSMHETIQKIDAYLNSTHISSSTDSLGREKPFYNIVNAATNIWYRAIDIDRKDIHFRPENNGSVVLAFVADVLLQNWMDENDFGRFLNLWGRNQARYGSAVVKFVDKGSNLIPSVIPWNRLIVDPVDFDALPVIEKFYKTPAQLRMMHEYDQDVVDSLINAVMSRNTLKGQKIDQTNEFIELYEVHGLMDSRLLEDKPDLKIDDKDIIYRQQMHVVSYVQDDKEGYQDFTLYKGKEAESPYMITHLIPEDGRTLSIGAVESLFDAQWMVNHSQKNIKDTLDLSTKVIFQTSDPHFVGRNVLQNIETGDILMHNLNEPLTQLNNSKPDISAAQNFSMGWQNLSQQLTNTPDLTRGISQAQPLTYGLGQIMNQNSNSLFELMTENRGLDLEGMVVKKVVPHLKRKLKNSEQIMGIFDANGIQQVDSLYIPKEAIKRYTKKSIKQLLNDEEPMPFDANAEQKAVKQEMTPLGNKRFFKPDEWDKKTWDELYSDFNWSNVRVEVTNENHDKQASLQTLTTALQTIAGNPMILQDPNAKMLFDAILTETGRISPMQIASVPAPQPSPMQPTSPVGGAS